MPASDPLDFKGQGPLLIHAHANGYPPQAYRSFLKPFQDSFQIKAIYLRPFWPGTNPDELRDWRIFRDDYLQELISLISGFGPDSRQVIGMGHSLGAMATLMAAIESPEYFRALVLIEPTLFPAWLGFLMRTLAPFHLFRHLHPLVRRTLRRKTSFPDRESMFRNYRSKQIFKGIPDEVLRDYVEGLAEETPAGSIKLRYSPAWEVRIYETGGSADRYVWKNLSRISCPVLVLRGERSDTLGQNTLERIARVLPRGRTVTLPSVGHLLPLEEPQQVAAVVLDFLNGLPG